MEIVYNWEISSMLEYPTTPEGLSDVVFQVNWRRNATTEVDGKVYSTDTFNGQAMPAPNPEDFTPYQDLTFEQVCGWLESILNVEAIDAGLDAQLENLINPPSVSLPFPWVAPVPPQPEITEPNA